MEFRGKEELDIRLEAAAQKVAKALETYKAVGKEIAAVAGATPQVAVNLKKVGQGWQLLDSEVVDLGALLRELGREVADYGERTQDARRVAFLSQMRELAAQANMRFEPITSNPPEYRLGMVTVLPDYGKGEVTVCYARLPLAKCALDANLVLEAVRSVRATLATGSPKPTQLWLNAHPAENGSEHFCPAYVLSLFYTAYRRLLNQLKPSDGRVPLVELLPEMSFLTQSEAFRKDPGKNNFVPYERAQLAWDLARLRHSGVMSVDGKRINIGVATLKSTSKKKNVLYVEDAGGAGQYYISLWFA